MQRYILILLLLLLPAVRIHSGGGPGTADALTGCRQLYADIGLEGRVDYRMFRQALTGLRKITAPRGHILTLIDFSQPSTRERLWVVDTRERRLLFTSHVAHGQGSGGNYATRFSNRSGSHQSSLGFYVTGSTYTGRNGYSLLLDGLEEGINDRARERAIVVHAASYADPATIVSAGRLGRSFGCPALPAALSRSIIDAIRDGSVMYIYADDPDYNQRSKLLNS